MGRGKRRVATKAAALRAQPQKRHARNGGRHGHGRLNPWVAEPCGHPHLPRTDVQSTLLKSIGYDDDRQIVEAEFQAGGIYHYRGVPLEVYEALFTAPSVGKYFNDEIKAAYPADAIHPSEYKETPAYLKFVKENLNLTYVNDTEHLNRVVDEILARPKTELAIDFECAIDSYSDKTRGCLRLVQLGVETPKASKKGKQWIIDCFRVDPTRVIEAFQSEHEKLIHYLFFEQDWASSRFGKPIKNIFDSCLAWRGIQCYLTNGLRALDHCYRGENVPRSVRRTLGCTITNREYSRRAGIGEGFGESGELDQSLAALIAAGGPELAIEDGSTRKMEEREYEDWLDEDVVALREVTEEENLRVQELMPEVATLLKKAGFKTEPLEPAEVVARLAPALGYDLQLLSGQDPAPLAAHLIQQASEQRAQELPKFEKLERVADDMSEQEVLEVEAHNRALAAQNLLVEEERRAFKERLAKTPFILPTLVNGKLVSCAFPDYDPSKRSATAFHPNTLAHVTKKILGFEIPKTEQAGYWGRPTLTSNQITYAAVDVAVLPEIARETKKVVAALGIEDEVYRRRIGASELRVAERVAKKLEEGGYVDHFDKAEVALRRAVSLDELDNAWHSFRQMALVSTSFERIAKLYESRTRELKRPRKSRRAARPEAAAATPF